MNEPTAIAKNVWSLWSKYAPSLLAGGVIIYLLLLVTGHASSHGLVSEVHRRKPYEYLYLDSARVDAYLSELDDGNVKSEERSESNTVNGGLELQVATLGKATASTGSERKKSAVVTRSEADNFYDLVRELKSEESLRTVDLESGDPREALAKTTDGTMVRLTDVSIQAPPYLSAYPALRYARPEFTTGKVFGPAPLTRFSASEVSVDAQAKHDRELFIKRVGENPRLPLTLSSDGMTILVPARFANITGDVSLFGTRLTVVGKVVFKGAHFGDGASVAAYLPALLRTSGRFLRDLGVRPAFVKRYEADLHTHRSHQVREMQTSIFRALERSLSFGPTVEVIPVAIYD